MTKQATKKKAHAARKLAKAEPKAETRSVVRADFRDRYREHGGTCGDEIATKLSAYVKGKDGKTDTAKLRRLAVANGIDFDRYTALNPGQQRMNVGNRLRALSRKGGAISWPRETTQKRRGRRAAAA